MSEETQELRDQLAQLRAENERLKAIRSEQAIAVSASNASASTGSTTERLVFVPREKKCPLFRGTVGISIEAWKEEAEACMRARHLSTIDKAYFLFDHLEGEAREEIRYRSRGKRKIRRRFLKFCRSFMVVHSHTWPCRRLSFLESSKRGSHCSSFRSP